MARAIWTGTLSFGLVNVPVGLFPATEDRSIHFNQFQAGTTDRVRNKRVNERTGDEVPYSEIVKGYELEGGEFVVVTPEDLAAIAPGRSKTIEVSDFVDLAEIDPVYFDKPYYLAPAAKGAERAYALLAEVMASADRAAIASFVLREKQYLVAVRAEHRVLVLQTLHFSDEVRQPTAVLDSLPAAVALEPRELEIARLLVDSMATEWHPEQYVDTYRARVEELIEQRRNGTFVVAEDAGPAPAPVLNLLDALQASMDALHRHGGRTPHAAVSSTRAGRGGAGAKPGTEGAEGRGATRADLLRRAGELGIAGRSKMSREDLEAAIPPSREEVGGRPGTRVRGSPQDVPLGTVRPRSDATARSGVEPAGEPGWRARHAAHVRKRRSG